MLGILDQALQAYQQHPGLITGEVVAQRRLGILQSLRTSTVMHQTALQERLQREEQRRLRQAEAEAARAAEQAARLAEEEAQRQATLNKLARR